MHGRLLTPRHYNKARETYEAGISWAIDNDGFRGVDEKAFAKMLDRIAGTPGCIFANAPDVYSGSETDHKQTLERWHEWRTTIRDAGFPASFVLQRGATIETVPWKTLDAVFIGGDDDFKLGTEAARIVEEAKRRKKYAHMGRVNSVRRIRYARLIGCDSVDGTGWARFRNANLPRALRELDQMPLFSITEAGSPP